MSANRKGIGHTKETKTKMSADRMGADNPFYGKTHIEEIKVKFYAILKSFAPRRPGFKVTVLDCIILDVLEFRSIRQVALVLNCDSKIIMAYNSYKLFFKGHYLIDYTKA